MSGINEIFSLQGKTAAVIGGSGVLGGGMVQALAGAGARTAIFYSGNPEGAEEQKALVEEQGGEALICKADVRSEESLKLAFQQLDDAWNRLDILVNAPGVNSTTPIMEITEEEWNMILDINLKGAFFASRIAAKMMIDKNIAGSIINISSVSSEIPLSRVLTYSISKAGLNILTRYMAREWAPNNIRVNAIMPGFFPAEQNREILQKQFLTIP
jgi:NAD(P)-dependent dehydrogenase (short-subunit alcohol dehydrogenase family)